MKAVILAGGFGTRLQSVVNDLPKPMAPVGGKPFLEYLIAQLVSWDIRDIILSVGYKADVIESYFRDGDRWGVKIRYSREAEPLGTGGALREVCRSIDGATFVLMNGDSFADLDLRGLADFHLRHPSLVTLGLVHHPEISRYGVVKIGEDGRIVSFAEKTGGREGLINSGVYVIQRRLLARIPGGNVSFEREILPGLVPLGIYGKQEKSFFIDIGVPEDYLYICKHPDLLKSDNHSETLP